MLTSERVKQLASALGADLAGIAPVARFAQAPEGFRPNDIFPQARSVLVLAKKLPEASFQAQNPIFYTNANNVMLAEVIRISYALCAGLESEPGVLALPVPSEPYDYWDAETMTGKGLLSLRHAGFLAGLGVMGKNTLLTTPKYGNRIMLGAALLNVELEGDALIEEQFCPDGCALCLKRCPAQAIGNGSVNQKRCRLNSAGETEKGASIYTCNTCRSICPKGKGPAIA